MCHSTQVTSVIVVEKQFTYLNFLKSEVCHVEEPIFSEEEQVDHSCQQDKNNIYI